MHVEACVGGGGRRSDGQLDSVLVGKAHTYMTCALPYAFHNYCPVLPCPPSARLPAAWATTGVDMSQKWGHCLTRE